MTASNRRFFHWALVVSVVSHLLVLTVAVPRYLRSARRPASSLKLTYAAPRLLRASREILPKETLAKPSSSRERSASVAAPSTAGGGHRGVLGQRAVAQRALPVPEKPALATASVYASNVPMTAPIALDIVPATSPALAKEPMFQLYYRSIRERIRAKAYQVVPKPFQNGDVFLSFVVARGGALVSLQLDETQSSARTVLRQAASRAVREASPFPPFPPVVTESKIAFTIVISFEEELSR